jgi:hypothetical protein
VTAERHPEEKVIAIEVVFEAVSDVYIGARCRAAATYWSVGVFMQGQANPGTYDAIKSHPSTPNRTPRRPQHSSNGGRVVGGKSNRGRTRQRVERVMATARYRLLGGGGGGFGVPVVS